MVGDTITHHFLYGIGELTVLTESEQKKFWIPDKKGNLIAQEGANLENLALFLNTTPDLALKMLEEQGYVLNSDDSLNFNAGDVFIVDRGKKARNKQSIGFLGGLIRSQSQLGLGEDIFTNYWKGVDHFELTGAQFAGILLFVKEKNPEADHEQEVILQDENGNLQPGKCRKISLYKSRYARTFGLAYIYYNKDGRIVGFYDIYDFNEKPWGVRSLLHESITRCVYRVSHKFATPVHVRYGYKQNS